MGAKRIVVEKGRLDTAICTECGTQGRLVRELVIACKPLAGFGIALLFASAIQLLMVWLLNAVTVVPFTDSLFRDACLVLIFLCLVLLGGFFAAAVLHFTHRAGACRCSFCGTKFICKTKPAKGLYLIVGPSGSGKSTVLNLLTKRWGYTSFASLTTRSRRSIGETGHCFVTAREMKALLDCEPLYAFNAFDKHFYGIRKGQLDAADICTVDPQGLESLRRTYAKHRNVYLVVLDVPKQVLRERMEQRGDAPDVIDRRIGHDAALYTKELRKSADLVVDGTRRPMQCAREIHRFIRSIEGANGAKAVKGKRRTTVAHIRERLGAQMTDYIERMGMYVCI